MQGGHEPAAPAQGDAVDEARSLFEDEGLPLPPIPPELAPCVRRLGPWVYGTRAAAPAVADAMSEFVPLAGALYFLDTFVGELEAGASGGPGDYLLLGHAGHGVESHAIHYYLVRGPLAIFLQLQWGTPDTDVDVAARTMAGHYAQVERLIAAVDEAVRQGRLQLPRRVAVCVSDFRLRPLWAVLDPTSGDSAGDPWHRERGGRVWDAVLEAVASL